jgi:methionine-rich copper-binding protein CopC
MSPYAVKPALVLWFLLLSCGVAAARQMHVQMSYPAAETVIDGRNAQYVIRFDGPVNHRQARLEIIQGGKVVQELRPRLESEPNALVASAPALPPGRYVLRWSVRSAPNGEATDGEIRFTVAG